MRSIIMWKGAALLLVLGRGGWLASSLKGDDESQRVEMRSRGPGHPPGRWPAPISLEVSFHWGKPVLLWCWSWWWGRQPWPSRSLNLVRTALLSCLLNSYRKLWGAMSLEIHFSAFSLPSFALDTHHSFFPGADVEGDKRSTSSLHWCLRLLREEDRKQKKDGAVESRCVFRMRSGEWVPCRGGLGICCLT